MSNSNPLARLLRAIAPLPPALRHRAVTTLFTRRVRFAGTGGICVESLDAHRAVVTLPDRPRVRNHIGTIHAAATALLAETASGMIFGLNLPGDRIPLLKQMHIDYQRRSSGSLRAVASLDDDAIARLHREADGAIEVPVIVTDDVGAEPVRCRMTWAWIPRERR